LLRFTVFAIAVLGGLLAFHSTSVSAAAGHTGQALALRAALDPNVARSALGCSPLLGSSEPATGRYVYNRSNWSGTARTSRTRLHAHVGGINANPNNINDQPVQTFDALAPPATNFLPGSQGIYGANNHNPVWSADESYVVFSSDLAGDGHDHLFYVPAGGGVPVQITKGPGNEEFPSLNSASNSLIFTSTANASGVANLYLISNFSANPNLTQTDVSTLTSLTIRGDLTTGFTTVQRPTFSPGGDRIAFSALSSNASDPNRGHFHIYFLYTASLGYRQTGQTSDNPPAKLTDGPADDTDPAWSFDSRYIAFASTANAVARNANSTIDPANNNAPALTSNPTSNGGRSLFLISGGSPQQDPFGTVVQTGTDNNGNPIMGRLTLAGTDNFGPAWSTQDNNQYLNPFNQDASGNPLKVEYLAFARGAAPGSPHDIYYLRTAQFSPNGSGNVTREGATINYQYNYPSTDANGNPTTATANQPFANNVVQLNTSDTGNVYDDVYPTFAPLQGTFRIAYGSNRSVTYNTANGTPTETAISEPEGSNGFGGNYHGILESEVVNVNPPTLLRFSGSEVIHVNAGTTSILPSAANLSGSATKSIQPTQSVTFTARLTNREAGIDDSKVFLQIKDPSSSTQNVQGLEHKVFTTDFQGLQNRRNFQGQQFGDSGKATNVLYNGGFGDAFNLIGMAAYTVRGAVGGSDGADYLPVGNYNSNTDRANPGPALSIGPPSGPLHTYGNAPEIDNNFQPLGQEYECQYVNPQYQQKGTGDTTGGAGGDYGTPFYLAGFDDNGAFVGFRPAQTGMPTTPPAADGTSRPTRPTQPSPGPNGTTLPAEWLAMTRLPDAQQDGQGGVLYTATFVTPRSASDFFLDVIAYDKAVFPSIPPPTASNFAYVNQNGTASANFRINDNTGGFSTAPFDGSHDILVVSDNALGQKFTFSINNGNNQPGQQNLGAQNLKPSLYGAESYFTDVDPSLVPNAIYRVASRMGGTATAVSTDVQGLVIPAHNGLGLNSYSNARDQQYSLWRTLSRGPVPESVLKSYETTAEAQPAVTDPSTGYNAPAADGKASPLVPVAQRCVVWVAPYTGDLLTDAGSLSDAATQQELRRFVLGDPNPASTSVLKGGGGRLFISGADVAETLTLQGNANNAAGSFLTDVLNASFASSSGGSYNPTVTAATGNRILYDAYFNANLPLGIEQNFPLFTGTDVVYQAPGNSAPFVFGNDLILRLPARNANFRTDSNLNQLTPFFTSFGSALTFGSIDTITAQNGAHSDLAFGGAKGLTYLENLKDPSNNNAIVYGSRTVFTSFGLEALGTEFYSFTQNTIKLFAPRNLRSNVLHNVVDYLRTGTFTGFIRTRTGTGVPGATVYLSPNEGKNIPGATRQLYSGTTDTSGQYIIHGVEPGAYVVNAYKSGFTRASTDTTGSANTVDGDTTANVNLNINLLPPGGITGQVVDNATPPNGVAGATVTFTSADGATVYTAITTQGGFYTVSNVAAGTYKGQATKPPLYGTSNVQTVTVTGGQTATANFTLPLAGAAISGRIYDSATGNDLPNALVVLTDPNGKELGRTKTSAQTDKTPNYAFTNIQVPAAGETLTITASATGYGNGTRTIAAVTPGAAATAQDIALTMTPPIPNGTLGGLVQSSFNNQPIGGVTVKILQGTTVVQTLTTSSTADNSGLNYGPVSLPPGTYTVTITASGYGMQTQSGQVVVSSTLTQVNFTLTPIHVFSAGLSFFSVPYNYGGAGVSFDDLLGTLSANRSHIYVYDPRQVQYVLDPTPPADIPRLGQGYWVNLTAAHPVTSIAPPSSTSTIAEGLKAGWNMIGVPSTSPIQVAGLSGLQFPNGTGGGSVDFAAAAGSTYRLISGTLYGYTASTNSYYPVMAGDTLQPWQAYWIYAYVDTTVLIPTQ